MLGFLFPQSLEAGNELSNGGGEPTLSVLPASTWESRGFRELLRFFFIEFLWLQCGCLSVCLIRCLKNKLSLFFRASFSLRLFTFCLLLQSQ